MKRIIIALAILILAGGVTPANAGYFADKRVQIKQNFEIISAKRAIKKILKQQNNYASSYNYSSLKSMYSDDFKSCDGFDKEVYFKLIKETWQAYPDITYTIEIKNITTDGKNASADVHETSLATTTQVEQGIAISGELNSFSNGTYYLKKTNGKWLITGEKVQNEKSFLKYGDTRFVDMDLKSPETVKAGEYYTASLTVDTPENAFIVASIGRDKIIYPQEKSEEVFRKLPDDNILERMFTANKIGKNEFNVASVGMTKSRIENNQVQVYMAGIAIIMTRVNVEEPDNAE